MLTIDLDPAVREVTRLLDGVTDDHLGLPTPCPDYTVGALLDHMMSLTAAFASAARKSAPDADGGAESPPGEATAAHLDPEWRTVLPRRLTELAEAWRDPAAWEGVTEAGGLTMPAQVMGTVALDELVLHGWDLARATNQSFSCDPLSAEVVLAFTSATAEPGRQSSRDGLFGPVVEVPEDASAFDRALGFAGRDPAWKP
ncbi:MAG: TIGR03086 family metal-binding protein [Micromonosporaceae bacterium]